MVRKNKYNEEAYYTDEDFLVSRKSLGETEENVLEEKRKATNAYKEESLENEFSHYSQNVVFGVISDDEKSGSL